MSSSWITRRPRKNGGSSFRVMFRTGGRESMPRYGGAFRTLREAKLRRDWIAGEQAALRVPDIRRRNHDRPPTLAEAALRWQASRVDLAENTRTRHGLELNRIDPLLGSRRVDALTPSDVAEFVAGLVGKGYARGTIRKTLQTLAMVLDDAGAIPNPARDKHVRLPREEPEEINPPTAEHLEAVYRLLPSKHRLAFLFLDWSGARISAIDLTRVFDYDEPRRRVRLRAATTKTRRALWIELHPALAEALESQLGPREDRTPDARLFPGSGADALRTSIAKACRAAGVPLFSPHDLRHRRISLLHLRGVPWARIGEFVGQRSLKVTSDTYTHVLSDETEVDYAGLLSC
jgi:integrase